MKKLLGALAIMTAILLTIMMLVMVRADSMGGSKDYPVSYPVTIPEENRIIRCTAHCVHGIVELCTKSKEICIEREALMCSVAENNKCIMKPVKLVE